MKSIEVYCSIFLYLSLIEFSYNNTPSATTGISILFTNKSYYSNILVYFESAIASFQAHNLDGPVSSSTRSFS